MNAEIISTLLMIVGGVTILTNIIVQVAEALTLAAGGAYASINGLAVTWYMVAAAIVVGLMSAYAAMFGFDKFKEVIQEWQKKSE